MSHTKLYVVLAICAGVALFLYRRPRLTAQEKQGFFLAALAAAPFVAWLSSLVLFDVHQEMAESQGLVAGPRNAGIGAAGWVLGLAVSVAVLWVADLLQKQRTEERFVQIQRDKQAALEAAEQRRLQVERDAAQLALNTRLQIAQTQERAAMLAIEAQQRQIAVDQRAAALLKANEGFELAFARYQRLTDPYGHKERGTIVDGFRNELGSRSIGRFDYNLLQQSDHPLVKEVLGKRPELNLTP